MKKLLFIFLLCITTSAFGQLQQKPMHGLQINWAHPLSKGLVGCWLFNEGSGGQVFDLSGNGNTGTLQGTSPSWTSGKFGSAVLLPGTNEGIDCNQKMTVNGTTGLTIAVWVYVRSSPSNYDTLIGQSTIGATAEEYVLFVYANRFAYYVRASNSGQQMYASPAFSLNTWMHLAVTLEGTAMKAYYNGALYGTDTADALMGTPTIDFYIGTDSTESYPLDCIVDNAVLWGHTLSASEIALLYQKPFCMFERDDVVLMAVEAPTGVPVPVFYYHYVNHALLVFPFIPFGLYCYVRSRKCAA